MPNNLQWAFPLDDGSETKRLCEVQAALDKGVSDRQRRVRYLPLRDELERTEKDAAVRSVLRSAIAAGVIDDMSLSRARGLFRRADVTREGHITRVQLSRYLSRDGDYVHPTELGAFERDFGKDALDVEEFLTYLLENPQIATLCDEKIIINTRRRPDYHKFSCFDEDDRGNVLCCSVYAQFFGCADGCAEKENDLSTTQLHSPTKKARRRSTVTKESPPARRRSTKRTIDLFVKNYNTALADHFKTS